jgi:3-oxoadipate enol-lactonase
MILSTPVNGFIGGAAALSDHDYSPAVATVTRPVLFIAGSKTASRPRR